MIARLWRGRTRAAQADEYFEYLDRTGLDAFRTTPGNRGAFVLQRRVDDDEVEFLIMSLWESVDAIRAFAGPDYQRPVYFPEDERYLLELSPDIDHYDVIYRAGAETE